MHMKTNPLINYPLWALLIFGFVSVAKVSLDNLNGLSCPNIFVMPICYVVTLAYGLMLGSLIAKHNNYKHHLFCIGWGSAFVIALLASLAEFFGSGGVCPSSSGGLRAGASAGIPLCYISLALLLVILLLFIAGPYKNACEIDNARS
jgi:hypothetical protein